MVRRWSRYNIAMRRDLASKTLDWTRDLVDLAEDDYTRELCLGVVWNSGMEDEDTYLCNQPLPGAEDRNGELFVRMSPPALVGTSL